MHIAITDYYAAANRGDAAIFEGVYAALGGEFPDATVTVMTEHPRAAELINDVEAHHQPLPRFRWTLSRENALRAYLTLTSRLYARGTRPPLVEFGIDRAGLRPLLEADLVVSTGGHFLTDVYFPRKVATLWQHFYLAQLDIPVVLYAQSLGPFERQPYRWLTRAVLDDVALIITRDDRSRAIVADLGVSTPVRTTADAAFSMDLDRSPDTLIDRLGSKDRLPEGDRLCVSISVREWRHTGADTALEDYVAAIAGLADWLVGQRDAEVLFASTCTSLDGYHVDDRLMAARVVDEMAHGDDDAVEILTGEYTPQQLVRIYGEMDLHVGMRMHSNVLAMLAGTPVVAIAYQFKTCELMAQFDLDRYAVDVEDLDEEWLMYLVIRALDERDDLADAIQARLPDVRRRSRHSAALVRQVLEGHSRT